MKKVLDVIGAVAERMIVPTCSVVIVAAGSSTRMGGVDKIMAELSGKPVILRSVEAFQQHSAIQEIVVVTREDLREKIEKLLQDSGMTKVVAVVNGGSTRAESVSKGMDCCSKKAGLIAIHDGARPLVTQEIITNTIAKAAKTKAAVPAIPVKDTVRIVKGGVGVDTPDRATLYAMQTPQIFDADLIRAATLNAMQKNAAVTDDCSAVELMGMRVSIVDGAEENLKITTRVDMAIADLLIGKRDTE